MMYLAAFPSESLALFHDSALFAALTRNICCECSNDLITSTPSISSIPSLTISSIPSVSSSPSLSPSLGPTLSSAPTSPVTWEQIGQDIDGTDYGDNLGYAVVISNEGDRLWVGGDEILQIYSRTNGDWVEEVVISTEFTTESVNCISLSLDGGTFVAGSSQENSDTGAVVVFHQDGLTWERKGQVLTGVEEDENFGEAVAINDDGSIIAVGASGGDYVAFYEIFNEQWSTIGTINEQTYSYFGISLSLTSTADMVIIGASEAEDNGSVKGSAFIYSLFPATLIQQMDYGEEEDDEFGDSVTMSPDGSVIAIGAVGGDPLPYVKIYRAEDENSPYLQISTTLHGTTDSIFGISLALSADGRRLAVGAIFDGSGGKAFVYAIKNDSHNLIGEFDAEDANNRLGWSVSLSGDGKHVAIGAITNSGENGFTHSGHVRVHESSPS